MEIENLGMKEIPNIIEVDYFMNSLYNIHLLKDLDIKKKFLVTKTASMPKLICEFFKFMIEKVS